MKNKCSSSIVSPHAYNVLLAVGKINVRNISIHFITVKPDVNNHLHTTFTKKKRKTLDKNRDRYDLVTKTIVIGFADELLRKSRIVGMLNWKMGE